MIRSPLASGIILAAGHVTDTLIDTSDSPNLPGAEHQDRPPAQPIGPVGDVYPSRSTRTPPRRIATTAARLRITALRRLLRRSHSICSLLHIKALIGAAGGIALKWRDMRDP